MFFTRHLSKMLFVTGLATASVMIFAIAPGWASANILGLPFSEEFASRYFGHGHHLVYRHWGVMVGMMGVLMIVASYRTSWRHPVVLFSFVEKFLMVVLFLLAGGFADPGLQGFLPVVVVDSIVSIWTIGYWIEQRSAFPDPEAERRSLAARPAAGR
jgi:hypothetical protein